MGEPGGNLFAVVRDEHDRWASEVIGEGSELNQQAFPSAQVQPGEGLVEQDELGIAHECPCQEDLLALTLRDHPEGPFPDVPHAGSAQQIVSPLPVFGGVPVPPGLQRSMTAADDDIACGQVRSKLPRHGSADQRNAWTQRSNVHLAEPSAQDLDRPRRGPQPGRGNLQQRGLARTIRAQDDPAFGGVDTPVDPSQNRHALSSHRDAPQLDGRYRAPVGCHIPAQSRMAMRRVMRPMRPEQQWVHVRSPASHSQISRR